MTATAPGRPNGLASYRQRGHSQEQTMSLASANTFSPCLSVIYLAPKVTGCLRTGHRQWQMQAPYRCRGLTPMPESVGVSWLRYDYSVRLNKLLMPYCTDNNEPTSYAGRPGSNSRVPDYWGNLTLENFLPRSGSCGPHADEGLHRSTRATTYNAPSLA